MPKVTVEITGASSSARFYWDDVQKGLTHQNGTYTASFDSAAGKHTYDIELSGPRGEHWTTKVTTPSQESTSSGYLDFEGEDEVGDEVTV